MKILARRCLARASPRAIVATPWARMHAEQAMAIEAVERRQEELQREHALKRSINDDQMLTLRVLEGFGWTLKFVRKSKAGPLAAVYDPEKHSFAIIEPDGALNERPQLVFRPC